MQHHYKTIFLDAIKPHTYTDTQGNFTEITKALGHSTRINILQEVGTSKAGCAACLQKQWGSPIIVSASFERIKTVQNYKIIKGSIDNSQTYHCLLSEKLNELIFLHQLV